jgi:hypothetical protein
MTMIERIAALEERVKFHEMRISFLEKVLAGVVLDSQSAQISEEELTSELDKAFGEIFKGEASLPVDEALKRALAAFEQKKE